MTCSNKPSHRLHFQSILSNLQSFITFPPPKLSKWRLLSFPSSCWLLPPSLRLCLPTSLSTSLVQLTLPVPKISARKASSLAAPLSATSKTKAFSLCSTDLIYWADRPSVRQSMCLVTSMWTCLVREAAENWKHENYAKHLFRQIWWPQWKGRLQPHCLLLHWQEGISSRWYSTPDSRFLTLNPLVQSHQPVIEQTAGTTHASNGYLTSSRQISQPHENTTHLFGKVRTEAFPLSSWDIRRGSVPNTENGWLWLWAFFVEWLQLISHRVFFCFDFTYLLLDSCRKHLSISILSS